MATYTLNATGNWNANATWLPATGFPVAGDTAILAGAFTLTVNVASVCDIMTTGTLTGIGPTVVLAAALTINTSLSTSGGGITRAFFKSSVPGTQRTITCANTTGVTYANFQDIIGAGAATWDLTGGDDGTDANAIYGTVGNCLGNSGITFPPVRDLLVAVVGGSSLNYWNTNDVVNVVWKLQDNVTLSRVALPHDNVTITSITYNKKLLIDTPHACANLTCMVPVSSSCNFSETRPVNYYGNITIAYVLGTGRVGLGMVLCGRGSHTISIQNFLTETTSSGITIDACGGTYALIDDLYLNPGATNTFKLLSGTFKGNGHMLTVSSFVSNTTTYLRTLDLTDSTIKFVPNAAGTALAISSTKLTILSVNSTLEFAPTGSGVVSVMSGGGDPCFFHTIKLTSTAHTGAIAFTTGNSWTVNNFESLNYKRSIVHNSGSFLTILNTFKVSGPINGLTTISGTGLFYPKCRTSQTVTNCSLTGIINKGAPLYAERSINAGTNINVNFYPADTWSMAKTLFAWGNLNLTEALTTAASALPSLDDRLTLVEAATTLLTAGVSLADLVQMVESVATIGAASVSLNETYTGVASYTESILTTATAVSSLLDAQTMVDNLTIMAQAGASVVDIQSWLENVTATATAGASVIDTLMTGMEQYLFIETARLRTRREAAADRTFTEAARARSFSEMARVH